SPGPSYFTMTESSWWSRGKTCWHAIYTFTLGDENAVLARSRPLILDPLSGHPESSLHVTNLNLRGTIKESAQLDGGFVVSREGIFLSVCRYLDAVVAHVDVQMVLGCSNLYEVMLSYIVNVVCIGICKCLLV